MGVRHGHMGIFLLFIPRHPLTAFRRHDRVVLVPSPQDNFSCARIFLSIAPVNYFSRLFSLTLTGAVHNFLSILRGILLYILSLTLTRPFHNVLSIILRARSFHRRLDARYFSHGQACLISHSQACLFSHIQAGLFSHRPL